jgi:hypothetical protein
MASRFNDRRQKARGVTSGWLTPWRDHFENVRAVYDDMMAAKRKYSAEDAFADSMLLTVSWYEAAFGWVLYPKGPKAPNGPPPRPGVAKKGARKKGAKKGARKKGAGKKQ